MMWRGNQRASAAGVSKGAVSFALNGRPGVAADTRRRILDAAERLGSSPSPWARALSVSKSLAVGMVIAQPPEIRRADAFLPSFIAGLETVLSARDHALLFQIAEHDDAAAYRRLATDRRVDGVFVTDLQAGDQRSALLEEFGLPRSSSARRCPTARRTAPGSRSSPWTNAPGIAAVVRHLVDLGHTRIAHVSGPPSMVHGQSRLRAWSRALREVGLSDGCA